MEAATQVNEGEKRFDLTLRYPESARNSVETIRNILLRTTTGSLVPLGDLARVELREGPALISREQLQRRIYLGSIRMDAISKASSRKRRIKSDG
jgi:cobalt-zinc-cadmium resistance protein CzcA